MARNSQKLSVSNKTPIPVILVMGSTGSGKTTFINTFLDEKDELPAGDDPESITTEITDVKATVAGREVMLVDTPGFEDTYSPEMTIANTIAEWLAERYRDQGGASINGIIYMKDIRTVRVRHSDISNRILFEKLIGPENFGNVRLMTSFWPPKSNKDDYAACVKKEGDLKRVLWKEMIDRGATTARFSLYD